MFIDCTYRDVLVTPLCSFLRCDLSRGDFECCIPPPVHYLEHVRSLVPSSRAYPGTDAVRSRRIAWCQRRHIVIPSAEFNYGQSRIRPGSCHTAFASSASLDSVPRGMYRCFYKLFYLTVFNSRFCLIFAKSLFSLSGSIFQSFSLFLGDFNLRISRF